MREGGREGGEGVREGEGEEGRESGSAWVMEGLSERARVSECE